MQHYLNTGKSLEAFQKDCLIWANGHQCFSFFNSNNYRGIRSNKPWGFKNILATGKLPEKPFNYLKEIKLKKASSWYFGHITYDYKNSIENLQSKALPTVLFPESLFYKPNCMVDFDANVIGESTLQSIKLSAQQKAEHKKTHIGIPQPIITKKRYVSDVKKLLRHIQMGDIYEVNYCMEFTLDAFLDPIETYWKLNALSPMPYSVLHKVGDVYVIGASPERFMAKSKSTIISQPIKGTIKRHRDAVIDQNLKEQLINDPKERSENIMIVDLVRNDLSKIATPSSVKVEALCEIQSFPAVHQMVSTISAQWQDTSFKDIVHALFPMGSMTGAPKYRAMQLIDETEASARGMYSGTIGYIDSSGNFDFNVVIRSLLYDAKKGKVSFHVGSAITIASDPEKEYQECLLKAEAMLKLFQAELQ